MNQQQAFSVGEFCTAHRISRAFFYLMLKDGRAPRTFKLGRRTLISSEAAAAWLRRMESLSEEQALL